MAIGCVMSDRSADRTLESGCREIDGMLIHDFDLDNLFGNLLFKLLLKTGISVGFLCCIAAPSVALEPVVDADRPLVWSQVMADGAGPIVYDRHRIRPSLFAQILLPAIGVVPSQDQFEILSSWSRSGIRVTRIEMVQVVDEVRRKGDGPGTFVYREEARLTSPLSIEVVVAGQSVRYESGPVSAELGAVLAGAIEGNVVMRLWWPDGSMTESRIGEGTVLGWKQVFR
jgi:hypothetical protein